MTDLLIVLYTKHGMAAGDPFDYILARSRTRESSTLTIATVASSASLVLLALYIQALVDVELNEDIGISLSFDKFKPLIQVTGITFAAVGILYRDVTIFAIHKADERTLQTQTRPQPNTHDAPRSGILRALLVIPIIAWVYVMDLGIPSIYGSIIGIGIYVGIVSWREGIP